MMMRRLWLIGVFCLALTCWATDAAAQEVSVPAAQEVSVPDKAISTMSRFLDDWLDKPDKVKATRHFSGTIRSQEVAPRAVWILRDGSEGLSPKQADEYWKLLNRITPSGGSRRETLEEIDPDLAEQLGYFVSPAVHDYKFTVFVAADAETINSFDAGYGDVAKALKPHVNVILTMIADFANRRAENYTGPFVSFWGEEPTAGSDGEFAWRIQALGAVPEVEAWFDGR